jgi:hypothetical protein
VLSAEGLVVVDGARTTKLSFDAALAAAEAADGSVLVVGPGQRAAILRGATLELVAAPPWEVHALTAVGASEWIGLAAPGVARFDGARWSILRTLDRPGNHIAALPDGGLALTSGLRVVEAGEQRLIYTESYVGAGALEIVGLAAIGDRVIVGLNRNNANTLVLGVRGAGRLEPHADQCRDSWIFTSDAGILWA